MEEKLILRRFDIERRRADIKFKNMERQIQEIKKPDVRLVKVGYVKKLTGMDKEGLRRARESNLITQVKNPKGIFYVLDSIHPLIIKQEFLQLVG